ncbi:MAG: hypothetical protein ACJ8HJ_09095 [Massilia sp.]|jgi:hypothetical protein
MSFDLYLIRLENGEPVQPDRSAILEVFRRYPNVDADGSDFYDVSFDDGSHVQLLAKGLETDEELNICTFYLRNFTFPIMRFIYEVAVAGDMMVMNPQGQGTEDSPAALIVNEAQRQRLWADPGHVQLLTSAQDLGRALGGDVSGWQAYRDQVVGGNQKDK